MLNTCYLNYYLGFNQLFILVLTCIDNTPTFSYFEEIKEINKC